ncbi:hypothetical protein IV203_005009 [Nitzschia inconspicua]|uniref:Transmembrane protein n=1 Tax=Nitzschia inconspicua TaxID=303405 RepID=A0A9K3PFR5_9STRA|nr:hypothetical protein IV203_005009 [Nitzschia inconspicua]
MSDEVSDTDNTVTVMVIVGCVGVAVFSGIYFAFWNRSKNSRNEGRVKGDKGSDPDDKEKATSSLPSKIAPAKKTTYALESKERQPGDPIYDKMIISGTASLGLLLWVGALIVMIVSLVNRSDFYDASASDFQSVGEDGCLVESAATYTYFDVQLNALNSVCVEQWEYNVRVVARTIVGEEGEEEEMIFFVSAPLSSESCRGQCQDCVRQNQLLGEDFYVGVVATQRGAPINANGTTVECFGPTIPVGELSGFYDCGTQREINDTCFQLQDTSISLEQQQLSVQVGLAVAYCGFAGGFLLLLLTAYFMYRNKQVREAELPLAPTKILTKGETSLTNGEMEDNAPSEEVAVDADSSLKHVQDGTTEDLEAKKS